MKNNLQVFVAAFIVLFSTFMYSQNVVTYNHTGSAQSFIVPPGVSSITIEAWGAGGGGGGGISNNAGGGGGGGAYNKTVITALPQTALSGQYTIVVGKGGATNVVGGNSSVILIGGGNTVEAIGGKEGSLSGTTAGEGGRADISYPTLFSKSGGNGGAGNGINGGGGGGGSAGTAGAGGAGVAGTASNGGSGGTAGTAGAGGSSGGVGGVGGNKNSTTSFSGFVPGAGGGGKGGSTGTVNFVNGGSGADGRVVITYTINRDLIDTDRDGVADWKDLDADNDGILDTAELYCDQTIAPNGAFPTKIPATAGFSTNAKQLLFFDWNGVALGGSTTGETRSVTHNGVTYTAVITNFAGHAMSGSQVLTYSSGPSHMVGNFYSFSDTNFKPVLYSSSNSPNNSSTSSFDFRITATKNGIELPVEVVIFDAEETGKQGSGQEEQLKFTVKSNGSNFSLIEQFGSGTIGSSTITGAGTSEITYINTKSSLNAMYSTSGYSPTIAVNATLKTSRQGVGFAVRLKCDTDNDGLPNYIDLDSDNDGCSDSNEYYNNTNTAVGQQLNQTSNAVAPTNTDGSVNLPGTYPNPVPASATNVKIATTAKFTTSPANQSVDENTVATFSAVATSTNTTEFTTVTGAPVYPTTANNNANIDYSWEVSTDAGVNWIPVVAVTNVYSGVTTATLSVTASQALNKNEYRAVVKLNNQVCMNSKSAKAKLNVKCYALPVIIAEPGNTLDSAVGISSLGRTGVVSNWPMVRKSGWIVLESKSKGFVLNRVAFDANTGNPTKNGVEIITAPIEGMMVFDTTANALKVYTTKNGVPGWYTMETQACRE